MAAIAASDISISIEGREILKNANFVVEQGEMVCIWGPSGGGKSTFLRVIAGLARADSGSLIINGKEADVESPSGTDPLRSDIGFVFQNCALISNLTVFDNVALPLRYHKMGTEEDIQAKVMNTLENMLVTEHADKYPHQISIGIQKRVAVARTLILDPSILLMDEPTAGLDFINRFNLLALLWNVSQLRKVTLLMVTHDLDIPKELGTKISVLANGQVSLPLPMDQLSSLGGEFMDELREEIHQNEKKSDII